METEKRILVAIDLNFETSLVLTQAAYFFRENSTKFYILHVISSDLFSIINKKTKLQVRMKETYRTVEGELKKSGLQYLNYEIFISYGFPAAEIINFSRKHGSDLIVIGTHQRIGFKEFISGSVSFAVAKNSAYPVLLIPLKNPIKLSKEELTKESAVSLVNPS
ncbi:MAG: universal stress protein [Deltaproteobacteria bacterium]|nr:universal stress protein [Deltaproteobacteria bacterium]